MLTLKSLRKLTQINSKLPADSQLEEYAEEYKFLHPKVHNLAKEILRLKRQRFIKYQLKNVSIKIVLVIAILTTIVFGYKLFNLPTMSFTSKKEVVVLYKHDTTMNLENFLNQLAYMESRNNPAARQFWGLYQIGTQERKNAGYGDISWEVYKKHPEIQRLCMINLLKWNKKDMKKEIDYFTGMIVDGILITESGILGLAHIGTGYAKGWLHERIIPEVDQYGNKPREYAKLGGYSLDLK